MIRSLPFLALLILMSLARTPLHAACVNPSGPEGEAIYNGDYKVMQFCNGTTWISMASSGTATEVDPKVGTLTSGKWCNTNGAIINCTQDAPSSAGGSAGQVQFNTGSALGGDSALLWDNTNKRLGVGTASPSTALHVIGTAAATAFLGDGSALTNLNATNLASGTVPTARLGSGTASASTYLRGDGAWTTPSGGTPGGSTTQVQFNSSGAFSGDSGFTYSTGALRVTGSATTALSVTTSSTTTGAAAIYSAVTGSSGTTYAGSFQNSSSGGVGVYGVGSLYGVFASTSASGGVGIRAYASVGTGTGQAGYFESYSPTGTAILAVAGNAATKALVVKGTSSQTGNLAEFQNSSGTALTVVNANGNVGIGTDAPGQKLSVAGTIESTSGGFKFPDGTTQTSAASANKPYVLKFNLSATITTNASTNIGSAQNWTAPTTGTVLITLFQIPPYAFSCTNGTLYITVNIDGMQVMASAASSIAKYANGDVPLIPVTQTKSVTAGTTYLIQPIFATQNFSSCQVNVGGNSQTAATSVIRIEYIN